MAITKLRPGGPALNELAFAQESLFKSLALRWEVRHNIPRQSLEAYVVGLGRVTVVAASDPLAFLVKVSPR